MWLVASMSPPVYGESAPLYESLFAWLVIACVGALVRVYTIMSLEIGLAVEALPATRHVIMQQNNADGFLHSPLDNPHAIDTGRDELEERACRNGPSEIQI